MQGNDEALELYLPLDESQDGTVPDLSGHGLDGTLLGSPAIVPDDAFGAVLALDGSDDLVRVADGGDALGFGPGDDFTLELWVRPAAAQTASGDPVAIVERWNGATVYPYAVRYHPGTGTVEVARWDGNALPAITSQARIDDGVTHHVAFVKLGGTLKLYIDGELDGTVSDTTSAATSVDGTPVTVGGRYNDSGLIDTDTLFTGHLAHLRLYSEGLAAEAIRQDMQIDLTSIAAFTRSHPIDFQLFNEDGLSILVVNIDPAGQSLGVEILNTSGQDMELLPLTGPPAADNYHFALWFRPGTLSTASLSQMSVEPAAEWAMSGPLIQGDGTVVVYLVRTAAELDFEAADALLLTLDQVSAAPQGGAHETQVELVYAQIAFSDEPERPISGTRLQLLAIVNQLAPVARPFGLTFTPASVLNQAGAETQVSLRLTNILDLEPLTLFPNSEDPDDPPATELTLRFDFQGGDPAPWALGTLSEVGSLTVVNDDWDIHRESQDTSPYWTLVPKGVVTLEPREGITFELQGVQSSLAAGQALAYLAWEDLPGHGEGEVVGILEKSPLVLASPNVGVGTASPSIRLAIGDHGTGLHRPASNELALYAGGVERLRADSAGRIGIGGSAESPARLQVFQVDADANGGALVLGPIGNGTSPNLRLGATSTYSWIQSHGAKPLALNPIGNAIAVGKSHPDTGFHLDVAGNVQVTSLLISQVDADANGNALVVGSSSSSSLRLGATSTYSWIQSHGAKPLAINPIGNGVAVGKTTPTAGVLLDVNGIVQVTEILLGSWTIREVDGELQFITASTTVRFRTDGTIQTGGHTVVRNSDVVHLKATIGSDVTHLGATDSGSSSHPGDFKKWAFWKKNGPDGTESDITVELRS